MGRKIEEHPTGWSPDAVFADIQDEIGNMEQVYIIWTNKDGEQDYRCSGYTYERLLWHLFSAAVSMVKAEEDDGEGD